MPYNKKLHEMLKNIVQEYESSYSGESLDSEDETMESKEVDATKAPKPPTPLKSMEGTVNNPYAEEGNAGGGMGSKNKKKDLLASLLSKKIKK